jgi:multidrug efflux pump subunit AcrB
VDEIGSPTIVATFLIIIVFIPMAFVTGMMGPYMSPIPFNVPITMFFSMVVAFVVIPWASFKFLKGSHGEEAEFDLKSTITYRVYTAIMGPLVTSVKRRRLFLGVVALLFLLILTLPLFQIVQFRLLPKADKETFKITVDMPQGTTLAKTDAVARTIGLELQKLEELKNYQTFTGIPDIVDFNGLLRGSSMKKGYHVAEIRVNITPKEERDLTSGQVALQLRPALDKISEKFGAKIKIVEDPPGPPTRSTILTEIYGDDYEKVREMAIKVRNHYKNVEGIVDVDDTVTEDVTEYAFVVDNQKATISGISVEQVTHTLAVALPGAVITTIHDEQAKDQVGVFLRLKEEYRKSVDDLDKIFVMNPQGQKIPLSVLVNQKKRILAKPIYHKDMRRVAYAYGEMSERGPVYAVFDLMKYFNENPLPEGLEENHDGEWQMTVDVFRDLGLAMAVGVLIVFLILVGWFHSFTIPMILMGSIPLTIIGVFPGHAFFEFFLGYTVYFSSTGMIGVIALSGIVVRNSIILIDFIIEGMKSGRNLYDVIVEAGAVRFRPIFLTAITNVLGVASIVLDPMWESLAWSIIFGMVASTTLTLFVIPSLYVEFVGERHPEEIF